MVYHILLILLVVIIGAVYAAKKFYERTSQSKCIFKVPPVSDKYDYRIAKPQQFRPWKPVYHMVMNISKVIPEEWLYIDSDYDWIIKSHQQILEKHPTKTCQANPSKDTLLACQELYNLIFNVLMQRYPAYFKKQGKCVLNTIRNTAIPFPAESTKANAEQLLRILVENTEEDFQLLQHDTESDEYILRAVGGLTSDGFTWSDKLNTKLTDVHGPVPNYKEKLKMSMNRFFNKLQPGSIIQRFTWGIQIGNPVSKFHLNKRNIKGSGPNGNLTVSDVDFDTSVWVRVERQMPTKLPNSGFLILTQHTYWYPISDIKREGLGGVTADAIEGWPDYFATYKDRDLYGAAVCEYLRA